MAEVWAKSDGNWDNTALWEFWNESTEQIEDYGKIPQEGDTVYCNGYIITIPNNYTINIGLLTNGLNPYTNRANGRVNFSISVIFNCNMLHKGNAYLVYHLTGGTVRYATFNGNLQSDGATSHFISVAGGLNYVINGNIDVDYAFVSFSQNYSSSVLTINGNVIFRDSVNDFMTNSGTINFNGNYEGYRYRNNRAYDTTPRTDIISGKIKIWNNHDYVSDARIKCNKFEYEESGFPFYLSAISAFDGDTFDINYVGEQPNPLPYIIMNKQQTYQTYPQEQNVKGGVIYGPNNEFEGTFEVDYPQEANVLKGVEYDDGNKVGTLEVIALSGATATADNISVVNLTEQEVNRVKNCATVSTVQKCFEDFKE